MFYNGIIFDLDNTLYDYDICHKYALNKAIYYLLEYCRNDYEYINNLYLIIANRLKNELGNTAASHNKTIYFKQLIEELKLKYSLVTLITETYWNTFYNKMECFEGVKEFIEWNKLIGKKIGILTDYQTEYQIIKLKRLGLLTFVDVIITSEEVGIEKPSAKMFQTILRKMNLTADEVTMVGDNYKKDIQGAISIGILSYWFTRNDNNKEFNNFIVLHSKFKEIYNELNHLKTLSKYCGERFDLVQAGGGNSSVKVDDWLFIKASGYNLSAIELNKGYVVIDNAKLKRDIANKNDTEMDITSYNVIGTKRGSIETFMHSILKKYTIHLHPIQLNRFLICKNARDICQSIYPDGLIIDYLTPGIKVCQAIKDVYNNEKVIFLINHGLIITCDSIEEIYTLLDDVLNKFEIELEHRELLSKYKHTNTISSAINSTFVQENITYLCENVLINHYLIHKRTLFEENITFPDALIYCGMRILFVDDIPLLPGALIDYKNFYGEMPKIIVISKDNNIYITSHSLNKCKEIEEVLKANLFILDSDEKGKNYLPMEEICFLNNWDSEKYRKLLNT